MTIKLTLVQTLGGIAFAKVDQKSDIDKIIQTFDCHNNAAITDETILDLTPICDDEEREKIAITLFGQENWDKLPACYIVFHG
jgi:hypothetical protein